MLVSYSDSEGSDNETNQPSPAKPPTKGPVPTTSANFAVDRSNPRKVRVNLNESRPDQAPASERGGEPAAKKPRLGAGGLSGFNAMLPPPKRHIQIQTAADGAPTKAPRKIFSLRTGAEPGFSRESDSELRQLFAEQDATRDEDANGTHAAPDLDAAALKATFTPTAGLALPKVGSAMMFRPLSVARGPKKKKAATATASEQKPRQQMSIAAPPMRTEPAQPPRQRVSLFSTLADSTTDREDPAENISKAFEGPETDSLEPEVAQYDEDEPTQIGAATPNSNHPSQSLETIASDLNLSAAARRQLLGRSGKSSSTAINIVNFNTDAEYAANEIIRASGEQVQHNPVRGIAPGKHSLKQLVNAASGQKDALEESFAAGKRNKQEAGSRYGW